jgi:hypothetical protein
VSDAVLKVQNRDSVSLCHISLQVFIPHASYLAELIFMQLGSSIFLQYVISLSFGEPRPYSALLLMQSLYRVE